MLDKATTHLIYGESGTFKTTQVGFFARWIWKRYRKKTRLVTAEEWAAIDKYVQGGLIVPLPISNLILNDRISPTGIIRKLSRGDWPRMIKGQLRLLPTTPEEWAEIGAYAVEGFTSIGDLEMEELRRDQRQIGQEAVGKFELTGDTMFSDKSERFSANNQSHYNFVQNELHAMIRGFSSLPIRDVLFTAHEGKGEDEKTRQALRGPAIVGKAVTGKVPSWVGDCIHADSYMVPVKDKNTGLTQSQSHTRMWFTRHPDPNFPNVFYPAKLRIDASLTPKVYQKWNGGYFEPTIYGGIDWLLDLEEELAAEAASTLKAEIGEQQNA